MSCGNGMGILATRFSSRSNGLVRLRQRTIFARQSSWPTNWALVLLRLIRCSLSSPPIFRLTKHGSVWPKVRFSRIRVARRNFSEQQYFKSQSEMQELFADLPQALANSVEIAKRCNLPMTLGKASLPQFPTPDGITLDDFMRLEAKAGLETRLLKMFADPGIRDEKRKLYLATPRVRMRHHC